MVAVTLNVAAANHDLPWTPEEPLFVNARVETVQGETARYAPDSTGGLRRFGHFPRAWPFHYGCLPGVVSLGDEDLVPGPQGEPENWLDVVVCGGRFSPGQRAECRVVGVALRADDDHKLLTVAADAPEFEQVTSLAGLPAEVCRAAGDWFAAQGVHFEFGNRARAWQVLEQAVDSGAIPVNRYRSAGGVVIHDNRVLLLERPERNEVRLPKGHVERAEPVERTARRETKEESGLRGLDPLDSLGTIRNVFFHDGRLFVRDETYFVYRWRGERVKDEEKQFRRSWASFEDAVSRLTFAAERYFLRRAAALAAG